VAALGQAAVRDALATQAPQRLNAAAEHLGSATPRCAGGWMGAQPQLSCCPDAELTGLTHAIHSR